MVLVPSATAGGVPLVLARLVEGLSSHQCAGGPWRLEDRRNCSQVSPCAGRLPPGRGPNADRPFDEPTTSTARRVAAATWMMSSTTVASRAYAVVPARRSRWSRGGASRPGSAPAAGSARHRADASRRDRAARSPGPQPASCRRSFRRGFRARAAPSTRHRWCPRPDQQPLSGCVGRDVLAGACVPNPGPAGAVPVRVRSRSSAGLRWTRGRLWHPRRQHRPLRTGPGSGDRCEGRRFAARRMYVPGILSSQLSQVCLPSHGTVPERRANVQKGARPRGTDRRCSVPFRGSAGRRKDAGTRWLGCCSPERSTGETHPRAKRPMNRAKTPLRRRAAPFVFPHGPSNQQAIEVAKDRIQGRFVETAVVLNPPSKDRIPHAGQVVDGLVAAPREVPTSHRLSHPRRCRIAHCRREVDEVLTPPILRPTRAKRVSQERELLRGILPWPIVILAVDDVRLLRMDVQPALRQTSVRRLDAVNAPGRSVREVCG